MNFEDKATERACKVIQSKNNEMSNKHKIAIGKLIHTMASVMRGKDEIRQAFPMATGLGKTVATTSFLIELIKSGENRTVVVATSTIAELEAIYKNLKKNLTEEELNKVGIFHSKKNNTNDKVGKLHSEVLLITHQHLFRGEFKDLYSYFDTDKKEFVERDLVIWDEAFRRAVGEAINTTSVANLYGSLTQKSLKEPQWKTSADKVYEIMNSLGQGNNIQGADYKKLSRDLEDFDGEHRKIAKSLSIMLSRKQTLLCHTDTSGNGLLSYSIRIPKELRKIVVLDASSMVSALSVADSSVAVAEEFGYIKSYTNVKVYQNKQFSCGKTTINGTYSKNAKTMEAIWETIKAIPKEEPILLCHSLGNYKNNFLAHLNTYLGKEGIDTEKDPDYNRITFIHWGQHKASNDYAHIKYIIAVGVMRRDPFELMATAYGQASGKAPTHRRSYYEVCEQMAELQQLIGRGSSRIVSNDEANESTVYVFDQSDFFCARKQQEGSCEDLWQKALPFATIKVRGDKAHQVAEAIDNKHKQGGKHKMREMLEAVKDEFNIPTGKRLKKELLSKARDYLTEDFGWIREGHSLSKT